MIGDGNTEGNEVVRTAIDALIAQTRAVERAIAALETDDVSSKVRTAWITANCRPGKEVSSRRAACANLRSDDHDRQCAKRKRRWPASGMGPAYRLALLSGLCRWSASASCQCIGRSARASRPARAAQSLARTCRAGSNDASIDDNRDVFSHFSTNMGFAKEARLQDRQRPIPQPVGVGAFLDRGSNGLGPLYNARGCQNCHLRGRPRPSAARPATEDRSVSMFLRLSVPAADR